MGTEVRIIGGVILAVAEKGLPQGTTVTVRDLSSTRLHGSSS